MSCANSSFVLLSVPWPFYSSGSNDENNYYLVLPLADYETKTYVYIYEKGVLSSADFSGNYSFP